MVNDTKFQDNNKKVYISKKVKKRHNYNLIFLFNKKINIVLWSNINYKYYKNIKPRSD